MELKLAIISERLVIKQASKSTRFIWSSLCSDPFISTKGTRKSFKINLLPELELQPLQLCTSYQKMVLIRHAKHMCPKSSLAIWISAQEMILNQIKLYWETPNSTGLRLSKSRGFKLLCQGSLIAFLFSALDVIGALIETPAWEREMAGEAQGTQGKLCHCLDEKSRTWKPLLIISSLRCAEGTASSSTSAFILNPGYSS